MKERLLNNLVAYYKLPKLEKLKNINIYKLDKNNFKIDKESKCIMFWESSAIYYYVAKNFYKNRYEVITK